MKLIPVALAIFHEKIENTLNLWVQVRTDDGPYHGLLEFPGGGIEPGESPLEAAVREVSEEVGIEVSGDQGQFMGTYPHLVNGKTILLYVFLFPRPKELEHKGQWLRVERTELSRPFEGKIPGPNHKIIDDLFHALNN